MLTAEQRKSLATAVLRYAEDVGPALPYLEARGITEATAKYAMLGYVRNPVMGHEFARGRLAIPYMTDSGPVAVTFRCIEDHDCKVIDGHSKYRKPVGSPTHLYGVQDYFTDSMAIHVTEGEIDRLTLRFNLGLPTFGICGSAMWKTHWNMIFRDFDHVIHWSDGDSSGDKLAGRMAKELGQSYKQVRLPDGTDVNSLYLEKGEEYLRSLIPK